MFGLWGEKETISLHSSYKEPTKREGERERENKIVNQ